MNWHAVVQTLIDESKLSYETGARFPEGTMERQLIMLQSKLFLGIAQALNNGLKPEPWP